MKSDNENDDSKAFEPIPECEWHTRDPVTGEIFFLSKGILYSKLPSKEKQKIIPINSTEDIQQIKENEKNKNSSTILCNAAKFSNAYHGTRVQIFGGQSIANCNAAGEATSIEGYITVCNILHFGIVELEFLCPISCYNLQFGMISQRDLENRNIPAKQYKNFKTSSRRVVTMKINYWEKECTFYLNGQRATSLNFKEEEVVPIIIIKRKTSCVILNPLVKYYLWPIKSKLLDKEIIFQINSPIKAQSETELKNYLKKCFTKEFNIEYAFGDFNEGGEINSFIIAKFGGQAASEIKENFAKICLNSNIKLPSNEIVKSIKSNITKKYDLSYSDVQGYLSKLNKNYQSKTDEIDEENKKADEVFKANVIQNISNNFEKFKVYQNYSINDVKKIFAELQNNKQEDMFNYMGEFLPEGNNKENKKDIIDYIQKEDSLLMIKNNRLKVIKREDNGLFDLTNFIELPQPKSKSSNYIIFERGDLEFLIKNFDLQTYFSYYPNIKKINSVFEFIKAVKEGKKIGDKKIIICQEISKYFYTSLNSYLNFLSFITKRDKVETIQTGGKKSLELKKDEINSYEKENLNIMKLFNFGVFDYESEDNDNADNMSDNNISYEDYMEYLVKDPITHSKLVKIVNKILIQLSIKYDERIFGNNNMMNAYENLSSFINYPFCERIPIQTLSDYGFYCQNSFTNELRLYNHNHKLVDTDMLNSNENIELYLKENAPSYLPNSPLRDLSPIINGSYSINNKNFVYDSEDPIQLYHINEKVPILATCSKKCIVNIYSYALGIKKLGSVNILKGIKRPQNFAEIGDILSLKTSSQNQSFEDFIGNKKGVDGISQKMLDMKNTMNKGFIVNEEYLKKLITMGFKKDACIKALTEKKNNCEEAIDYILAHPELLEGPPDEKEEESNNKDSPVFIGKWSCPQCTYENSGVEKCEMCEMRIPDDLYDKFLNSYSKGSSKKKDEKLDKSGAEEKNLNLMEDDEINYKDVLVKNIHIAFDPYGEDPFCPFVLVAVLFNFVENKMLVNTYKLMINPECIISFMQFNFGKYSENVTNRRDHDYKLVMSILNQKHFYNMNVLYPIFVGQNGDKEYRHLIPIEHFSYPTKINSYYDSCIYNYNFYDKNHKPIGLSIFAINEEQDKKLKITKLIIDSPLYAFNDKKSNMIVLPVKFDLSSDALKASLMKVNKNQVLTELKIFQDDKNIYILAKNGYIAISKETQKITEEKTYNNQHDLILLKRVVPIYNKELNEIKRFIISDEAQSITIDINAGNVISDEKISDDKKQNDTIDIDGINVKSFSIKEIENLSNLLDNEKIDIILPEKGKSCQSQDKDGDIKGLIKVNNNDNLYNKVYFDINKKGAITKTIKFTKSHLILYSDLELAFELNNQFVKNQNQNIEPVKYNNIVSKPITKDDLYKFTNLIPLNIYDYKGSQSQYSINVSNLVSGAHRFISNYPKPEFIFTHLNNELMIIDNIIISSDVVAKSIDIPFGEGLIFLMNSLESIEKARKKFSKFNYTNFENFLNEKKKSNEDIYDYEPVSYIKMGNNEIVSTNLLKYKKCKYIYLLPVNGRDCDVKIFEERLMSFLFFGVQGKVSMNNMERVFEDRTNYINNQLGDKSIVNNLKIEIFGYNSKDSKNKKLFFSKDKYEINDIILNKDILTEFYLANIRQSNSSKDVYDSVDIVVTNNSNEKDALIPISASLSFISFKSIDLKDSNLMTENKSYKNLLSKFDILILNQDIFEKFVMSFIPCLLDSSYDKNKKCVIVKYFNNLFIKKAELKSKILPKIDYFNFMIQNIFNDNNNSLSSLAVNFIFDSYQDQNAKKAIEESFMKVLNEFKDIEFTNNGFNNFAKLLSMISLEKNLFKEKILSLLSLCLKNIEENKYQTNTLTYLNTFLYINNYPSDQILFENSLVKEDRKDESNKENSTNINNNKSIKFMNALDYKGNIQIHKEFLATILCMKETNVIEELDIFFDDSKEAIPAQGYNFRLQIYTVKGEKDLDLKSFKYYYDHTWKLLTKTYGKTKTTAKNKDLKDAYIGNELEVSIEGVVKSEPIKDIIYLEGQNNVIKINFKKWNNEFNARYLYFEISINDGTKDVNQIPSLVICPVILGHRASTPLPEVEGLEKFMSNFVINKKAKYSRIQEFNFYESNFDKKRILIEYKDENKTKEKVEGKKKENELPILYNNIKSKSKEISEKVESLVKRKRTNEEKEKIQKEIYELSYMIHNLQNQVNEFCPKSKLEKSFSFNIQLINILILELNIQKDLNLGDIYNILIKLIDLISFNQVSNTSFLSQINEFVTKYYLKNGTQDDKLKLFNDLVIKYMNVENPYRDVRIIIIDKIWELFDVKLFVEELKKVFADDNMWNDLSFPKLYYKISILILIISKKIEKKEERDLLTLKDMSANYSSFINKIIKIKNNLKESYINLILNQVLSLYYSNLSFSDKNERLKDNEPEKTIEFLIELIYITEDLEIRDKIGKIINLIFEPYQSENYVDEEEPKEKKVPGDKIIIQLQKIIIKYLDNIAKNKTFKEDNYQFEYVMNLLDTSYNLNRSEDEKIEEIIYNQNHQIVEGFMKISSLFKDSKKIGYSHINNFWKYFIGMFKKGKLALLFYKNNFTTLIIDCFLTLDKELQILLYSKLNDLFLVLYRWRVWKSDPEKTAQILQVIIHIMKNELNTDKEMHLLDFLNNLLTALIYGCYKKVYDKKDIKIFHGDFFKVSSNEKYIEIFKELFYLTSQFLVNKLNYSSFGQSQCGSEILYKRTVFMNHILYIIDMYTKDFFAEIKDTEIMKEDFSNAIKQYLIFLTFNNLKVKTEKIPVLVNIYDIRCSVSKLIEYCTGKNAIIKVCLKNILEIGKKVDKITYDKIKKGTISYKKGIKIILKLFQALSSLLNVLLINDETTKYFSFELDGFKFFIDRITQSNLESDKQKKPKEKNLNTIEGINDLDDELEIEEGVQINQELLNLSKSTNQMNQLEPKYQKILEKFSSYKTKEKDKLSFAKINSISFQIGQYPEEKKVDNLNNPDFDYPDFTGNLDSYKTEEFATSKRLNSYQPGMINVSNYNWSSKKKPTIGSLMTKEFNGDNFYEEKLDFKSLYPIDLKEVMITFSQNEKVTEVFPEVYLEAGIDIKKLDICVKLEKLKDEQYSEKNIISYGFNFYSNHPESIKNDDNYIENYLNQFIKCKAQYFRFIIRRPVILTNKNSHAIGISTLSLYIGLNCISLIGAKSVAQTKVLDYINVKEKHISIQIISKIFTNEFIDTLRQISLDKKIFENIKQIYIAFEPVMNQYVQILSKILINASKYNFELGEWLMNKLLNINHGQIYAKFAVEIMKNNPEYVEKRINRYCTFIFNELKNCDEVNKLENMKYFIEYFCLTLNGLLISPFMSKIKINIDLDEIRNIMFNLYKYKLLKRELINLIALILLPHNKVILNENEIDTNKFYHPNNSLKTLTDLYNNSYSYDYTELISILVSNNNRFEKVFVESEVAKYFFELTLNDINNGIRGRNMLFMVEMLKNMSYNLEFAKFVRKNDYDFKLFKSIKTTNEKSDSILINNNCNFSNNIILFLRNCVLNEPSAHKKLAEILIEDLKLCKKKFDQDYANRIIIPLLSLEKVSYVCVHPIIEKIKSNPCSYINLESSISIVKDEKDKKDTQLNGKLITGLNSPLVMPFPQKIIEKEKPAIKSIIPESDLSLENQLLFTELFTSFEYQKGQKYPNYTFKRIINSKSLTSLKLKPLITGNLVNHGPFLIILYPAKAEKYPNCITFLFYNGTFPSLEDNDDNIIIPYKIDNFIGQINDKKYITASLKQPQEDDDYKENEYANINAYGNSVSMNVLDLLTVNFLSPELSNVNPYPEIMNICKKKDMEDLVEIINMQDYEVFLGTKQEDKSSNKKQIELNEIYNEKIVPLKYIDEIGSLNIKNVNQNRYYVPKHPLSAIRDNPIFEIPSNVKLRDLKEMFYSKLIPFKNLANGKEISDDTTIGDIENYVDSNIVDLYYDIQSLRNFRTKVVNGEIERNRDFEESISYSISEYEPNLPILKEFENLGGIKHILSILKSTIHSWKNKEMQDFWYKWIDNMNKFSQLPTFFSSLIRHKKCFNLLFSLLCGIYDKEANLKTIGVEASKYMYEILENSFIENKTSELRKSAIENGIFGNIMEKLSQLTHEKGRKYEPKTKEEREEEEAKEKKKEEAKKLINNNNNNNKKTKGVGYGSDRTGDNKGWDVNLYLEGKKTNSTQVVSIINLLNNFFNISHLEMEQNLMNALLTSPILPCLESAYRGGTLLELSKDAELYTAYLQLTVTLSKNHSLIPLLLDISKDYTPAQTQSVFNLLSLLNDGAKIFINCLNPGLKKEKSTEEKLANEIINSYNIVSKNIEIYQSGAKHGQNITEILKLPLEKSYPLLLRELAFDYMSMKGPNGNYVHYYSSSYSGSPTPAKAIRLAQEFADLPRALPCESTNSIYVRVDKDNMDYMKVLIIGSEGTPYSNGAFQFDVFFDNQYPNVSPKVTLMTTGNGTTRFNPNLYANGKVCLSLLGTWRGNSTENWDPKISTLLQVLISIQSIIMSDLVYYNEPSCESEMGTTEGEQKNEAYSNIVRYSNIKYAMIGQIKEPSKGFEEVIRRHFYLKKDQILKEVRGWIERSRTASAKYTSFSYEHNSSWANKFSKAGEYTKMLEEIYKDLEYTLTSLPLPQMLKKKAEDEKIESEKKIEKMKFENLDKVDMSYDDSKKEQKTMNINDDKVKDRWSRYIGAMGMEAVKRQANSTILVYGAGGLGIEIAKNLVLSGCKELVLQDNKTTNYYDLSSQFYLKESDLGKNRAESCIKKLQNLNYYVKVTASTENLPTDEKQMSALKKYNVIVLTECDYETAIAIDKYCRQNKIHLIMCDIYGAAGRIINDFGNEFVVNDKDGEEAKEIMVKDIKVKDGKTAEVSVLEGLRHDFSDDDLVEAIEVVGLDGINKKHFTVKSISKDKFELIGDFSFAKNNYIRNGIIRQIKTQKKINFNTIGECLNNFPEEKHSKLIDSNMLMSDFTKISNGFIINIAFMAINQYLRENKYFINSKLITSPWNYSQLKSIMDKVNKICSANKIVLKEEQNKLIHKIIFTHMVQFSPLCAYFGGFAAQEVIKAITFKYSPVNQIIYQDCLELVPDINIKSKETIEESLKEINYKENNNRLDGLQAILGQKLLDKLINMKCLIVGAGAIGCELVKNFAMLNVGTGSNGSIVITDPDIIEVSNLTRQFLFREKHLRLPKSSTAAAAAIQMNPNLSGHIFAKLDKVCEETENIFSDTFFSSLDFVANALDNVNARRYVDSRCVANRKPLLESGTLGPKGHVQVVVPFKTESYGSQNDPEVSNDIPQCTLKMFPEEAIHCVEWARDQFGKKFTQLPKALNKRIEEANKGEENNDIKLTKKTIKWLKKLPKTFDDCLKIARDKFNKVFVINIKQLMYSYPLDKKDKNGKLFWTLPKRPPVALDYSINDQLCTDFISAYACLMANMFNIKIPYTNPRDPKSKADMILKTKNLTVEEFKPNETKAKEIENEVENEENKGKDKDKDKELDKEKKDEKGNEEQKYNEELIKLVKDDKLGFGNMKPFTAVEFEKDDDTNFQIDIMYAMSALRCRNYKLEIMDWMTVKIKAGRIIPALATTTSSIAALQTLELVKIAKNTSIEVYRNSFLNLAIPLLQSSEPGPCSKNVIREGLTATLWDRWDINIAPNLCTIKNMFEILRTKYLLFPRDIFKGKKPVYSYAAYKDKKELNEELINKKMDSLLGINIDKEEYVDLMVTFTPNEKSEEYIKNVPKIRLIFK